MSRSFVLSTLVVLFSGIGCQAQEPKSGLQESVARLEEKLARVEGHLQAVQQQKEQQAAANAHEAELASLAQAKAALDEQQRALSQQQAAFERDVAEVKKTMAGQLERAHAEQREQDTMLAKTRKENEALRAQLAKAQAAGERGTDLERALATLADERRELERLRAAVVADVAKVERGGAQTARLREENEHLRARVQQLEQQLAPAAPGSITIDNTEGEVHFHFHGPAPNVTMPAGKTPRAPDTTPGPAGPSGPKRAPARVDEPRRRANDEAPKGRDGDEQRLNQAPPAPTSNFVQVLPGKF